MPITCIKNGKGRPVLLVSGNHGDEYEGQVTVMKLTRRLQADDVKGRMIILAAANYAAAMAGTRTSPIDQGNLNRTFPGNPDGGPTAMIAHFIESVLPPMADVAIDLHSGGSSLMYIPSALARRAKSKGDRAETGKLMEIFGAPVSMLIDAPQGEDRTLTGGAERVGVLHMGTELGGSGTVTPGALSVAEKGTARLLDHFGVLRKPLHNEKPGKTRLVVVAGPSYYTYAPDHGLFEPYVELGDDVKAGPAAGGGDPFPTPPRGPPRCNFFAP